MSRRGNPGQKRDRNGRWMKAAATAARRAYVSGSVRADSGLVRSGSKIVGTKAGARLRAPGGRQVKLRATAHVTKPGRRPGRG